MLTNRDEAHGKQQPVPVQEAVTRNAHGESLDDARDAFRMEWETKLRGKRHAAAQARQTAERIGKNRDAIIVGGPALSACFGAQIGALVKGFPGFGAGLILGGLFGIYTVIPLLLLCRGGEWFYRQRAERLEHQAGEMERG